MVAAGFLIARDGARRTGIVARKGPTRPVVQERRSHALGVPAWGGWENLETGPPRSQRTEEHPDEIAQFHDTRHVVRHDMDTVSGGSRKPSRLAISCRPSSKPIEPRF